MHPCLSLSQFSWDSLCSSRLPLLLKCQAEIDVRAWPKCCYRDSWGGRWPSGYNSGLVAQLSPLQGQGFDSSLGGENFFPVYVTWYWSDRLSRDCLWVLQLSSQTFQQNISYLTLRLCSCCVTVCFMSVDSHVACLARLEYLSPPWGNRLLCVCVSLSSVCSLLLESHSGTLSRLKLRKEPSNPIIIIIIIRFPMKSYGLQYKLVNTSSSKQTLTQNHIISAPVICRQSWRPCLCIYIVFI